MLWGSKGQRRNRKNKMIGAKYQIGGGTYLESKSEWKGKRGKHPPIIIGKKNLHVKKSKTGLGQEQRQVPEKRRGREQCGKNEKTQNPSGPESKKKNKKTESVGTLPIGRGKFKRTRRKKNWIISAGSTLGKSGGTYDGHPKTNEERGPRPKKGGSHQT